MNSRSNDDDNGSDIPDLHEATVVQPRSVLDDAFDAHTIVRLDKKPAAAPTPAPAPVPAPVPAAAPSPSASASPSTAAKVQPKVKPLANSLGHSLSRANAEPARPLVPPSQAPKVAAAPSPPPKEAPKEAVAVPSYPQSTITNVPVEPSIRFEQTQGGNGDAQFEAELIASDRREALRKLAPKLAAVVVVLIFAVVGYLHFGRSRQVLDGEGKATPPQIAPRDNAATASNGDSRETTEKGELSSVGSATAAGPTSSVLSEFDEAFSRTQVRVRADSASD